MGRPKGGGEKYDHFSIRINSELKKKLKKYAKQKGITMTEAIEDYIKGLSIE